MRPQKAQATSIFHGTRLAHCGTDSPRAAGEGFAGAPLPSHQCLTGWGRRREHQVPSLPIRGMGDGGTSSQDTGSLAELAGSCLAWRSEGSETLWFKRPSFPFWGKQAGREAMVLCQKTPPNPDVGFGATCGFESELYLAE